MKLTRVALRLVLVIVIVIVIGRPSFADKLSAAEWKQVETDAEQALAKSNLDGLKDAIERASKDQSVRALRLLEKIVQASEPSLAACSKGALALDDKNARKELRKDAQNAKAPPRVRIMLAAALNAKDAEEAPILLKLVTDSTEEVAVSAIRTVAEAKVESTIEPLIAAMEKQDGVRGVTWEELRYALADLLGRKLNSGAEYKSRWAALKAKGGLKVVGTPDDPAPPEAKGETGKAGAPKTVELFGHEVACTRVVFILDVSGSMTAIDDPNVEVPPETKGKEPKKGEADVRSRIERAKRELKKVLKALPKTAKVNIISFSSFVRVWKQPLVLYGLDDATREDAMKFVDTFSADGTTVTDEALAKAFEIEGAHCFYLLSDGEPTKDGTTRIPTEVILKLIEEKNAAKKIRIHTLGFVGADQEFMKAVAKATGGEYSDIK